MSARNILSHATFNNKKPNTLWEDSNPMQCSPSHYELLINPHWQLHITLIKLFQLLQPDQFAVREHFFVLVCYEANSLSFFWRILLFIYLGILQLLGIVLTFQTRRVKYTGLRDSKYITAIIYISSIVLAILALVTFSLRTHINIGTGIFVSGYFILTTIFLSLIFIPKVL